MSIQILRGHNGHDVYRVVTPSGVVGFIATEIPDEVLALFMRKLKRKIRDGERREAHRVLVGSGKRRR
jgi:hypothetical protein